MNQISMVFFSKIFFKFSFVVTNCKSHRLDLCATQLGFEFCVEWYNCFCHNSNPRFSYLLPCHQKQAFYLSDIQRTLVFNNKKIRTFYFVIFKELGLAAT